MKIRDGFVSNSSSTAFILDLRHPGVKEIVDRNVHCPRPQGLGRGTALAVGQSAVQYAKEYVGEISWEDTNNLGEWILHWAELIGEENVVFARESDEGMGGYLTGADFGSYAVAAREYH